jgi:hypothetical protein
MVGVKAYRETKVGINTPHNRPPPKPPPDLAKSKTKQKKKGSIYISINILNLSHTPHLSDSQTVQETLSRHDADRWRKAIANEITVLWQNKTFTLAPLPPGRKVVKCK